MTRHLVPGIFLLIKNFRNVKPYLRSKIIKPLIEDLPNEIYVTEKNPRHLLVTVDISNETVSK